jgi:RNA-directed DNA polymerase
VVEGDIKACFDEISHCALLDRVRARVGDKRVLALVKAFLKSGILGEDRILRETSTGTPQGSILSPLLSNVALSVLDEHIDRSPGGPRASDYQRSKRRACNLPNYRLIRYADDWCLVVSGTREDAEALRAEIAGVLTTMGLRLSPEKTLITHIDQGLDFLGWHIQRRRKQGTDRYYVYTYPAKKAIASITGKVRELCRQDVNLPLEVLLHRLNAVMRGWCNHFRPGVSSAAFGYLRAFAWRQVFGWLRRKHRRSTWKDLRRRYCGGGWWPCDGETALFNPAAVRTTRYRYRGTVIPSPWPAAIAAQG